MDNESKHFVDILKGKNIPDEKLMMLKMVAAEDSDSQGAGFTIVKWLENQVETVKKVAIEEINKLDIVSLLENIPIKKELFLHLFIDNSKSLCLYSPIKKTLKKINLNIPSNLPELSNSLQVLNYLYVIGGKSAGTYVNTVWEFGFDDPANTSSKKLLCSRPNTLSPQLP